MNDHYFGVKWTCHLQHFTWKSLAQESYGDQIQITCYAVQLDKTATYLHTKEVPFSWLWHKYYLIWLWCNISWEQHELDCFFKSVIGNLLNISTRCCIFLLACCSLICREEILFAWLKLWLVLLPLLIDIIFQNPDMVQFTGFPKDWCDKSIRATCSLSSLGVPLYRFYLLCIQL